MNNTFKTHGVCASKISYTIEEGILKKVDFTSGCNGSLAAIGKLVEGMKVEDVIEKLKGTKCGPRATSCPDQLTRALEQYLVDNK